MNLEITTQVILLGGILGAVLGAVANKTNFCTMGAVSDWINMGDLGRMRSWFLAIAVAILGILIMEAASLVDITNSRPAYRSPSFFWSRYLLGGLMFGVGMTLGSGCAAKSLIRVGNGNLKSLFVLLVMGVMAYLMTRTDFYGIVFHSWMSPISPNLTSFGINDQTLGGVVGSLIGMETPSNLNPYLGGLLAIGMLYLILRSAEFRANGGLFTAGLVIGLAVATGWYITAGPMGREWLEFTEFMDAPPPGVGAQSFTFVNPAGELIYYFMHPTNTGLITFGLASLFGVLAGSFLYAISSGSFRFEWFANLRDFINHIIGAILMGIGGVLAMGCTFGQGITGASTLAAGSFMALGSIILGSALTMKVQYYKLIYEQEATFVKALLSGMADLRLLPQRMRKLDRE